MATATSLLRPGDVLGGFKVEDVIGIGGMAIVYRAQQVSLGRPVALKVLSSNLTRDANFRERFRREGMHAATLEHPNIVPVYDSGEEDGILYIAMRLVEGTNLAELIQSRGVTADQTIDILRPVASALDTAHAAGLIHRDVKPQNVLITLGGHPYLADFGVAKGSNTYGLTATGGFVGSINYASPEQINGLTLTPASDVYALTAVLFQCLTGQVPYPRETDAGVMHAHLHEPPPTLPAGEGVDSSFHSVLARGMAKDPGSRYGHAGDLLTAAAVSVNRLPAARRTCVPAFPPVEAPAEEPVIAAETSGPTGAPAPVSSTGIASVNEVSNVRAAAHPTTADQRREPLPEEPIAKTRTGWRLPATAASLVVAIGIVIVIASGGSSTAAASFRSGALRLSPDSHWHKVPGTIAGVTLGAPISIADGNTTVYAGSVPSAGVVAAEVPRGLLATYGPPDSSAVVALPLGAARRYLWAKPTTAKSPLVMLIVSTSGGEYAIACATSGSGALTSQAAPCMSIARRATIVGAQLEYPGGDPVLAAKVTHALGARSGITGSPALHSSRLPARAGGLEHYAAADEAAAKALGEISSASRYAPRISALHDALLREAGAARSIAKAAQRDNRSAYAALRGQVASTTTALQAARASVADRGLSIPVLVKLSAPPPPPIVRRAARKPASVVAPETSEPTVPTPTYVPPPETGAKTHTPPPEEEFATVPK